MTRLSPLAACTVVLSGLLSALPAQAQSEAAVLRCLDVSDSAARLACFDQSAKALRDARAAGAAAAAAPVTPSAAATPAAIGAPAPTAAAEQTNFGRSAPVTAASQELVSQLTGDFDGWERNQRVKLANGQIWQITEDGRPLPRTLKDPKVVIRRGFMGSVFYMNIDGVNMQLKVKRVQ